MSALRAPHPWRKQPSNTLFRGTVTLRDGRRDVQVDAYLMYDFLRIRIPGKVFDVSKEAIFTKSLAEIIETCISSQEAGK